MTRSLRLLYIALFLALLLVLAVWSLGAFLGFSVPPRATVLDGKWAKAVETRYDEEFPLKRLGTNLWAALDYTLFDEGRPGVVLGRNNWLFSDEEFKPEPRAEQNIDDNLRLVQGIRQSLERRGIDLVLAIVPAKARLYPEHLGERQPARLRDNLYQRFHLEARRAGIVAPDLLASLEKEKGNGALFLRTDTHWTPHGAEVAAQRIGRAVQRRLPLDNEPQRFVTDFGKRAPYQGDLTRFLPLDPLFSDLLPPPDHLQQRTTRAADAGRADAAALFDDARVPVALVGTSYSANPNWNFQGALRQALGSDLVSYAEDGNGPLQPMLEYLQSDDFKDSPPQLVIWEFPERYLPMAADLSRFDPEWVAQLKASAATDERLVGATD
ncbi:alginate O-acetyltransferase [Zestomonas carbonaria]|uniref:Probable alginate O-acetylase AlgJ n=1 Tax=Zestomonas carbonaria TaxID=2762745 RepID=A0A7U7ETH1_9GAMM|nr:alginate O-acetyltransferase [Pseudomonas carbonaria]CAD5110497.1 putative alginate O-acetylase AlgJ [Pseudomonas carbonaria]